MVGIGRRLVRSDVLLGTLCTIELLLRTNQLEQYYELNYEEESNQHIYY